MALQAFGVGETAKYTTGRFAELANNVKHSSSILLASEASLPSRTNGTIFLFIYIVYVSSGVHLHLRMREIINVKWFKGHRFGPPGVWRRRDSKVY